MNTNPLLECKNDTPDSYISFDLIKDEHFEPAFVRALEIARENIKNIVELAEDPTFENTIEALEYAQDDLTRITSIFINLKEAHTNETFATIAKTILPQISEFSNEIKQNSALFEKIKAVHDNPPSALSKEQVRLLERTYIGFVRNGALLSSEDKETLTRLDKELVLACDMFAENLLGATNVYVLHITNETDLAGLPLRVREMGHEEAMAREKEGWVFTLQAPSYIPFMKYAENAILRKELWTAFNSRGMNAPFDNKEVVLRIVRLRKERAMLLGYQSHADYVLEDRMAKNLSRIDTFFDELYNVAKPLAEKDFKILCDYKEKSTGETIFFPWDVSFYQEKLIKETFDVDEDALRPYFEVSHVLEGIFTNVQLLYGISVVERNDIPVYHNDVRVFEIKDEDGTHLGLVYFDMYPRSSKAQGGWIDALRTQSMKQSVRIAPHLLIVTNVTKPTQDTPSLISFFEAETLFHEFGHALHDLFSHCQYTSLAGTKTLWDFVELPSQFMDLFTTEAQSLELFAKHYQTGEILPKSSIEKIVRANNFMSAWFVLGQLGQSVLDMAWYREGGEIVTDIERFEEIIRGKCRFFPQVPGTSLSTIFKHIFSGGIGYDAGYYSYHWAEVLAADAFEYFKENGLFSKELATKFREHVLSKGNTEAPDVLYRAFRGRDADPKALFRLKGLL